MARARNIKPSLFKNEDLGTADPLLTILFAGLWCLADKSGRLEDRPLRINAEIFPYRGISLQEINGYLTVLASLGLIRRYKVGDLAIIQVVKFEKHQSPHKTEKESELPPEVIDNTQDTGITVNAPLNNGDLTDTKRSDSLIPDSLIPDSLQPSTPAVAGDDGLAEAEHQSLVLCGVLKEFGLKKLSAADTWAWQQASVLAFENDFTPDEFLECLALLRKQHWRTSAVKPQHVTENLPILPRLRAEAIEQAKADAPPERLPTLADKQAELEASRKTLIPPPSAQKVAESL